MLAAMKFSKLARFIIHMPELAQNRVPNLRIFDSDDAPGSGGGWVEG